MIHLIKLCVGCKSVDQLEQWRAERRRFVTGLEGEFNVHRTRMMPKRAKEIEGQGSLYWVIGGQIRARQEVVGLVAGKDEDGRGYCDIVMRPEVVRTVMQPKRPFQGWRYLRSQDAPADLPEGVGADDAALVAELSQLGLI